MDRIQIELLGIDLMTCIAAVVENGLVVMGGDSLSSNEDVCQNVENHKVFHVQNFLIGCTASFRSIDILKYCFAVPRFRRLDDAERYMRTTFVNALHACFEKNKFIGQNSETGRDLGGSFLVGFQSKIYQVQDDFSVLTCPNWGGAVGSGQSAALGSLYTSRKNKNAHQRVLAALEAAEAVTPSVRSPFVVLES